MPLHGGMFDEIGLFFVCVKWLCLCMLKHTLESPDLLVVVYINVCYSSWWHHLHSVWFVRETVWEHGAGATLCLILHGSFCWQPALPWVWRTERCCPAWLIACGELPGVGFDWELHYKGVVARVACCGCEPKASGQQRVGFAVSGLLEIWNFHPYKNYSVYLNIHSF